MGENEILEGPKERTTHSQLTLAISKKWSKIEIVLPALAGSMILKTANSHQVPPGISFLQLARHWLVFFENHKNQSGGDFRSAGRNARGRWGEI